MTLTLLTMETMSERSLSYVNPLGAVTLEERISHARARVRKAQFLANLNCEDRCYAVALEARVAELRALEALRPPSGVKRKKGPGCW